MSAERICRPWPLLTSKKVDRSEFVTGRTLPAVAGVPQRRRYQLVFRRSYYLPMSEQRYELSISPPAKTSLETLRELS